MMNPPLTPELIINQHGCRTQPCSQLADALAATGFSGTNLKVKCWMYYQRLESWYIVRYSMLLYIKIYHLSQKHLYNLQIQEQYQSNKVRTAKFFMGNSISKGMDGKVYETTGGYVPKFRTLFRAEYQCSPLK